MWDSLTETKDRTAESVEQDQPAHTCSLILLYTLLKIANCRKRVSILFYCLSMLFCMSRWVFKQGTKLEFYHLLTCVRLLNKCIKNYSNEQTHVFHVLLLFMPPHRKIGGI